MSADSAESLPKSEGAKRDGQPHDPKQDLQLRLQQESKFLENCREVKTTSFLQALSQLCHSNVLLSHEVWLELFPRIWKILSDRMQQVYP